MANILRNLAKKGILLKTNRIVNSEACYSALSWGASTRIDANQKQPSSKWLSQSDRASIGPTNLNSSRSYSTDEVDKEKQMRITQELTPLLMLSMPSVLNSIKNWASIQFVMKAYLDKNFDKKEFVEGAKYAVEVCVNCL